MLRTPPWSPSVLGSRMHNKGVAKRKYWLERETIPYLEKFQSHYNEQCNKSLQKEFAVYAALLHHHICSGFPQNLNKLTWNPEQFSFSHILNLRCQQCSDCEQCTQRNQDAKAFLCQSGCTKQAVCFIFLSLKRVFIYNQEFQTQLILDRLEFLSIRITEAKSKDSLQW